MKRDTRAWYARYGSPLLRTGRFSVGGMPVTPRMLASLSEIVIALRVPPEDVRELYHTWLVGLCAGEVQRKEPRFLRGTPISMRSGESQRCSSRSCSRAAGEAVDADQHRAHARRVRDPRRPGADAGFVEYRNLSELGGFDVSGPIALADIMARVGAGQYRVSAYGFEPRGLRWEVFLRLGRSFHEQSRAEEAHARFGSPPNCARGPCTIAGGVVTRKKTQIVVATGYEAMSGESEVKRKRQSKSTRALRRPIAQAPLAQLVTDAEARALDGCGLGDLPTHRSCQTNRPSGSRPQARNC